MPHVVKLMRDVLKRKEGAGEGSKYSTDESVLASMPEREVPSAKIILAHRGLTKMVTTYLDPVVQRKFVYADGCFHTNFNTMVTATGRLSSDDPNLQNFPIRTHPEVRQIFEALPGYKIVSGDYGQIEARVIAMASEDRVLVDAMWTDFDIHGHWADYLAHAYPQSVDRMAMEHVGDRDDEKKLMGHLRQELKNGWVFPQFFGAHFESCARNLKIPPAIASQMSDIFWGEFQGVKRWQKKLMDGYDRRGYVETLTGRRRHAPLTKNEIINTPIQGTASDIVVDAWNRVAELAELTERPQLIPRMNIHDDLTFLMPLTSLEQDLEAVVEVMCAPTYSFINVPLLVEISMGDSWDAKKKVGTFRSDRDFGFARG